MRYLINLARSNVAPRLLVATLLAVFFYHGLLDSSAEFSPRRSHPLGPTVAMANVAEVIGISDVTAAESIDPLEDRNTRIMTLAETDHLALLNLALENYTRNVQAFSATFYKQERINGKLKPTQKIAVQFKEQPFSLLMKWQENIGTIDKLLYVEGSYDNKMIVHPAGLLAWIKSVRRDPAGRDARKSSRRTCNQFGFRRTIEGMIAVYQDAQSAGDLQMSSLGRTERFGRPCVTFVRTLPPKDQYPCARMVVDFDLEYLLPVSVSSYDWQENLLSQYSYRDLDFNASFAAAAFTPAANGL